MEITFRPVVKVRHLKDEQSHLQNLRRTEHFLEIPFQCASQYLHFAVDTLKQEEGGKHTKEWLKKNEPDQWFMYI